MRVSLFAPCFVDQLPPISVMPPMLGILTPEEIRYVVSYLAGLKPKTAKAAKTKK